jgi:hypothetical protein
MKMILSLYGFINEWPLAAFCSFLIYMLSVGFLARGISPFRGRYLHTDIHASSGIRTQDPSVRTGEEVHVLDSAATVIGYENHTKHK